MLGGLASLQDLELLGRVLLNEFLDVRFVSFDPSVIEADVTFRRAVAFS